MSVMLMTTSTPRAGDVENCFPAHYGEADQMARFSSTGGCRYNNGSDRVTLLAMYITILHILCHDHYRLTLHHPGQIQRCHRPLGLHVLIPQRHIFCLHRLLWSRQSCVQKRWVSVWQGVFLLDYPRGL